jgi:hypothetical protein
MKSSGLWHTRRRILLGGCLLLYLWLSLIGLILRVAGVQAVDYQTQIGPDVEAQLAYIRDVLHETESVALRQPNSVWVVFAHTLYGFSLVNTVLLDPEDPVRRAEAVRELEWILERLTRPEATRGFAPTQVPYGVFYLGERNLTLAGLMLIDDTPSAEREQEFHLTSCLLYDAFMASPSAHLATFPGYCWPADNVPAVYSLILHDRLYGTDYGQAAKRWVEALVASLDPKTGLMASRVDCQTGEMLDIPRGCALSLTFAFLADLSPQFAASQYAAYRQQFFKTTLGFAGIREYPPGQGRRADIDSGPIFLEVGAAATGFGIAATKAMADDANFESIVRLSEIIGLPVQRRGQKSYLLGQLLVGDEIQVWGKTVTPWSVSQASGDTSSGQMWPLVESLSLGPFYGMAGLVGGILLLLTLLLIRRVRRQPQLVMLWRGRPSGSDLGGLLLFGAQATVWLVVWFVPVLGLLAVLALSAVLEFTGRFLP